MRAKYLVRLRERISDRNTKESLDVILRNEPLQQYLLTPINDKIHLKNQNISACKVSLKSDIVYISNNDAIYPVIIVNELAHGGNAFVYSGYDLTGRYEEKIVIKSLMFAESDSHFQLQQFENEKKILSEYGRYYGQAFIGGAIYIASKFIVGKTLDNYIKDFDERAILASRKELSLQYIEGVQVLYNIINVVIPFHESGYINRDFKPANIMVNDKLQCTLIDFGSSNRDCGPKPISFGTKCYLPSDCEDLDGFDLYQFTQETDLFAIAKSMEELHSMMSISRMLIPSRKIFKNTHYAILNLIQDIQQNYYKFGGLLGIKSVKEKLASIIEKDPKISSHASLFSEEEEKQLKESNHFSIRLFKPEDPAAATPCAPSQWNGLRQ